MLGNADPSLGSTCLLEGGLLLLLTIQATRTLQVPWQAISNQHSDQRGNIMYHFLVIIEKGAENYGAYAPDLPGCVAVGDTLEATEKSMHEAIEMHMYEA